MAVSFGAGVPNHLCTPLLQPEQLLCLQLRPLQPPLADCHLARTLVLLMYAPPALVICILRDSLGRSPAAQPLTAAAMLISASRLGWLPELQLTLLRWCCWRRHHPLHGERVHARSHGGGPVRGWCGHGAERVRPRVAAFPRPCQLSACQVSPLPRIPAHQLVWVAVSILRAVS